MRRILVRQRLDQRSVHKSEDRHARANAKGHHDNRSNGKCRVLSQLSNSKAKVLDHALEKRDGTAIAVSFFCRINAAQLHDSDSLRFLRGHTGAQVVVDMHLEMTLDLVSKIALASSF